jgi:PAS domain S-box-containing protein
MARADYDALSGPKRFGDRLLDAGLLTRTQLDLALDAQQARRGRRLRLGRTLVELGFLTERDLTQMLSIHLALPMAPFPITDPDARALGLLPSELALRHRALPCRLVKRALLVAVADTVPHAVSEELAGAARMPVLPYLAPEAELDAALREHYGALPAAATEDDPTPLGLALAAAEQQSRRLAEDNARLRVALDSVTDAVLVFDAAGAVVDVSRSALELLGARVKSEVRGRLDAARMRLTSAGLETPLAFEQFPLGLALAGKTVQGCLVDVQLAGAPARTFEVSAAPLRDELGAPAGAVVVLRDVTKLQAARDRAVVARAATAFASAVSVDALVDAVLGEVRLALGLDLMVLHEVDTKGNLVMLGAYGLPGEIPGDLRCIPLDAPLVTARAACERRMQVFEDLLHGPAELSVTRRLAERLGDRAGVAIPLLVRDEPVGTISCGRHAAHAFSARDIETMAAVAGVVAVGLGNARLHRAAEHERRRLEAVIEHLPAAVMFFEPTAGRITVANAAVEKLVGWRVDDETPVTEDGRTCSIRRLDGSPFPPDALPSSRALRGEVVLGEEVRIEAADGRSRVALVNAAPVRDARGGVAGAVVAMQDISRVKELERMREEFISIIAHDLRTPIGVIQNYAHMLQRHTERGDRATQGDGPGTDGAEVTAVEGIAVSARRLATMVADLLDASRMETHRLALVRETLDLPRLLGALVERIAPLLGDHPVVLEAPGAPREIPADAGRIEQVVTNLLTNAAKFSPAGAEIAVTVEAREEEVLVSVADRGPGIPAAERAAIFDRFYRAPSTTGDREGFGIGLYIARGLVQAHGGRMWADARPGGGTTVCFTLPVGESDDAVGLRASE